MSHREQIIRALDSIIALLGLTVAALYLFATESSGIGWGEIEVLDAGLRIAFCCDIALRLLLYMKRTSDESGGAEQSHAWRIRAIAGLLFRLRAFLRHDLLALITTTIFFLFSLWEPTEGAHFALQELSPTTLLSLCIITRALIVFARVIPTLKSVRDIFANTHAQPARAILFGFAAIILAGSVLLSLPQASAEDVRLPFIDALFMATSSVCVTGLSVCDVTANFSVFGQVVLLFLIQMGGLGIMTIAVSIGLAFHSRISLSEQNTTFDQLDVFKPASIRELIRDIIRLTLSIEFAGALFIFLWRQFFAPQTGMPLDAILFASVFQAVSAFCSCGISLGANSMIPSVNDPVILGIIIALSTLGSLGFLVVVETRSWLRVRFAQKKKQPLSLHSRIVLITTALLIAIGAIAFYLLEWDNSMRDFDFGASVLSSLFQSSASRTAGFSTIDFTLLHPAALLVIIVLMFIGSSPGSTGGGVKTTTFAVMWFAIRSVIQNRDTVVVMHRTIPREVVIKALAITACFLAIIFMGCLLLLLIQPGLEFLKVLFEVISAAGTVGLSAGITQQLAPLARLVIILIMFLGRIGPLTLIIAAGGNKPAMRAKERYPRERIMVG
ncbi:MAG: hypothetical protein LBC99_09780 [Spirochaetota bacterium]|jgi:trk system potassium uptake protein TrkH|nr:hypothetical protein [Spirochaetota bacterium]